MNEIDAAGAPAQESKALVGLIHGLRTLVVESGESRIPLSDIVRALGERPLPPLMLLFAVPNVVPMPPGTSTVLGIPLVFFAAQWALGRPPWLPPVIARRTVPKASLAAIVERLTQWLARTQRCLRPRLPALTGPPATRSAGWLALLLAIVVALPIPFGNILPALAISMLALGALHRDGAWMLAGAVTAIGALVVVWEVLVVASRLGVDALLRLFG